MLLLVGSSPHMRGTQTCFYPQFHKAGIIPAHAGNTPARRMRVAVRGDHPRTCGEHRARSVLICAALGSSPHMRGTPCVGVDPHRDRRIIPAHAGNTYYDREYYAPLRDHPRTCGEHVIIIIKRDVYEGSSPHMRGTQHVEGDDGHAGGIIPAHAGNT